MHGAVSNALDGRALLLSPLFLILLSASAGAGRVPNACAERSVPNCQENSKMQAQQAETSSDPQVKIVHAKMSAAGIGRPATVADVRKAYLFYPKLSGAPEAVFRVEDREIPGAAGNVKIRIYTPNPAGALPMLVFFHGGGFVAGSLDTYENPLRAIANRCECIVVSVAYRLAPENKYPAAPEDAYAATKWIAEHAADIGGDSRRIAVGGDGAGGNLAAVVTLMARERVVPHLMFQVLIYPMLDASTMGPGWFIETDTPAVTRAAKHSLLSAYLPVSAQLGDPFISPNRASTLTNLPPALVIAYGGHDPMGVEGETYARRLMHDGVAAKISLYPKAIHGFFLMAGELDAGKRCIDETAAALKSAFTNSQGLSGDKHSQVAPNASQPSVTPKN
jgi:acetyl esterase